MEFCTLSSTRTLSLFPNHEMSEASTTPMRRIRCLWYDYSDTQSLNEDQGLSNLSDMRL